MPQRRHGSGGDVTCLVTALHFPLDCLRTIPQAEGTPMYLETLYPERGIAGAKRSAEPRIAGS